MAVKKVRFAYAASKPNLLHVKPHPPWGQSLSLMFTFTITPVPTSVPTQSFPKAPVSNPMNFNEACLTTTMGCHHLSESALHGPTSDPPSPSSISSFTFLAPEPVLDLRGSRLQSN